jgi:hypothetical protein
MRRLIVGSLVFGFCVTAPVLATAQGRVPHEELTALGFDVGGLMPRSDLLDGSGLMSVNYEYYVTPREPSQRVRVDESGIPHERAGFTIKDILLTSKDRCQEAGSFRLFVWFLTEGPLSQESRPSCFLTRPSDRRVGRVIVGSAERTRFTSGSVETKHPGRRR